jgi:archaellum component FlaC
MMGGGNEAEESGKIPVPKSVPSSASVSDETVEPASVTPAESASTTSFSTSPVSPLQNAYEASIMQILPKLEVDNLINQRNAAVKENIDLNFRLNTLLSEKSNSMITLSQREREIKQRDKIIEQRDVEIAELRGVNKDLKQRIQDLEAKYENLNMRIRALEGETDDSKRQINELNSKVNKMIAKDEFEKFLVAIEDLSSLYTLEEKCSFEIYYSCFVGFSLH